MKLTELVLAAQSLATRILDQDGELTPELESELSLVEGNLEVKVDQYCALLERLETETELWSKRKAECDSVLKRLAAVSSRLKDNLKGASQALCRPRLDGHFNKVSVSPSKGRLIIEDNLDPAYTKVVQSVEPDKERIREALENGQTVVGAHIEPGLTLRITAGRRLE